MLKKNKIPVLFVGFGDGSTGFSRVIQSILEHIPDKYQLHHFALNIKQSPPESQWCIHPNILEGDFYGEIQLKQLVDRLQPAIVFMLNDLGSYSLYSEILEQYKRETKSVYYCAIDSKVAHPREVEDLITLDRIVVFTHFGKSVLEENVAALKVTRPHFKLPPINLIPHGVDTNLFYPLSGGITGKELVASRLQVRRLLFPQDSNLDDAFIVLNANRNNPRKRIDITMEGFALFAKNKPENIKLYLHMNLYSLDTNLLLYAEKYGIKNRLLFSTRDKEHPEATNEKLNLIYNACDVGINTSSAEGWGLVSFEHAATGAAQIVPKHSACEEIWQESAMLLEPVSRVLDNDDYRERVFVSPEGVAEALEKLYENRNILHEMSVLAYKNATQPQYLWRNIAQQWDTFFQSLFEETDYP